MLDEPDDFAARHGAENAAAAGGAGDAVDGEEGGEEGGMVLDARVGKGELEEKSQSIPAYDIDAFWLQRQIGQIFEDAHTQQEKTSNAFDILSSEFAERPCAQQIPTRPSCASRVADRNYP